MSVGCILLGRAALPSTTVSARSGRFGSRGGCALPGDGQGLQRVLGDVSLASRLRRDGRRWIEDHYDWRRMYPAWDAVYAGATKNGH